MKINPFEPSRHKATLRALESTYKTPGAAADKQQAARGAVDAYLASGGAAKLLDRAQKIMDAALKKTDLRYRHFLLDDALVPALQAKSHAFAQAENLMDAMGIEEIHGAICAAGHKTMMLSTGFREVDDAPLCAALTDMLRDAGNKHQFALAYASQLSAGALDAFLGYSRSPTGQRMLRTIKALPSQIADLKYAPPTGEVTVSEKLQRKRDKLERYLQNASGDDSSGGIVSQWQEMGVHKDVVLTTLARNFSERDLDAALAWSATPEAKELATVQCYQGAKQDQVAFFSRPENAERYTRAMRQMQASAQKPDVAGNLINLLMDMKKRAQNP